MGASLRFEWEKLPTSVNDLYIAKYGRKILSKKGRQFRNEFILSRGGLSAAELMDFHADPEKKYCIELWFFISPENLYNLDYGVNKRKKSPFQDLDTSNLIKLAEDCVASVAGLRDKQHFDVLAHKREATDGVEGFIAVLRPLEETA